MIRRFFYVILCCLVLFLVGCVPVYAADYSLSEEIYSYDYIYEEIDIASDSDATLLSAYQGVYDGSISTTYLTYARDTVSKLGSDIHYVFFRPEQYEYRLVYGTDLEVTDTRFSGSDLSYVSYNSRYSTMSSGVEGAFSLETNNYLVYTDLQGMFPTLDSGVRNYEFKTLLFILVLSLLFSILCKFFSLSRYKI